MTPKMIGVKCDDPRIYQFGVLLEAMARLNAQFDASLKENCGISQVWFEALLRLERSGGSLTMSELADQVALTSGGVTRLIDRLLDEGLVERRPCDSDRRVLYAAITDAGRSKLQEALDIHLEDLSREYTSRMSADELAVVTEVMDRLRKPSLVGDRP